MRIRLKADWRCVQKEDWLNYSNRPETHLQGLLLGLTITLAIRQQCNYKVLFKDVFFF